MESYRKILRDYLWNHLESMDIHNMLFQQCSVTCHVSDETLNFLRERFGDRIILFKELKLIVPQVLQPYTTGLFPMKLFEETMSKTLE